MRFYTYIEKYSHKLFHVYYEDGKKYIAEKVDMKTFVGKDNGRPESKWKDIYGNPLKIVNFDCIEDQYHYIDEKKYLDINVHNDIAPPYQFIAKHYKEDIEFDLSWLRIFLIDIEVDTESGYSNVEDVTNKITAISVKDIKDNCYYTMSLKPYDKTKTKINVDPKQINFKHCKTEEEMFYALVMLFQKRKPDVLLGFYSNNFDLPYIINRGKKVVGDYINHLSPFKKQKKPIWITKSTDKVTKQINYSPNIAGIVILDYYKMYKKFVFTPRESYSLDFISEAELGENKLDYSEYGTLNEMWQKNPQQYIDYNIYDVELIHLLDQKLNLIELTFTIAYLAKCKIHDVMGTIKVWDCILYNDLMKRNILCPPILESKKEKYAGAYVFEPKPSIYKWMFSLDLASLYPHIQQQYNISPECIVNGYNEEVDWEAIDKRILNKEIEVNPKYIMAGNGQYFRKDKEGMIPKILKKIYAERKEVNADMDKWEEKLQAWKEENSIDVHQTFDKMKAGDLKNEWAEMQKEISKRNNKQMALKILMNAEYGALGNRFFRYYDIRLATAITLSAQLSLKFLSNKLMNHPLQKKYKWEILYGDTDSLYISCEYLVKQIQMRNEGITKHKLIDQVLAFIEKIIQPIIDDSYQELAEYMNANENRMFMKREKIIESAMLVAKKKYAMMVWQNKTVRYDKPKLKYKGIEIVRSSTPKVCRDALKEVVEIMLTDIDRLRKFVLNFKRGFKNFDPEQIAIPKSANNIEGHSYIKKGIIKYRTDLKNKSGKRKGIPITVKSAITYNNYISMNNLKDYPPILSGDKIRYIYMRNPNPAMETVFGFLTKIPEDLHRYVDFNLQFEKVFMNPVNNIHNNMGMLFKLEKETNLLDFF